MGRGMFERWGNVMLLALKATSSVEGPKPRTLPTGTRLRQGAQ